MAKHAQNRNERDGEARERELRDHAAQASALLGARTAQRRAVDTDSLPESKPGDQPRKRLKAQGKQGRGLLAFLRRNIVYIACVVAVIAVFVVGLLVLRVVLPAVNVIGDHAAEEAGYVSPYDWTKLDRSDGRFRYVVDGQVKSRLGVDVSENQHDIDWGAVASDGIDFAMIRLGYRGATEGDLYLDGYYQRNLDGARAAGLGCGVYFFSQAVTVEEAVAEADFVLEHLNGTPLEYPIAFDSETVSLSHEVSRTADLSNDAMTAIAEAFCNRVKAAGYRPMIYGNRIDLSRYHYSSLEQNPIWWAEYGAVAPTNNIDIDLWQYANDGSVAGIPTSVDMNIDVSNAV